MRKRASRTNSEPQLAECRVTPIPSASRLLLTLLLACQVALFFGGLHRSLHGSTDFRAFYAAGRLVLDGRGGSLYRPEAQQQIERRFISTDDQTLPFLYPPFAALLFAPLAALPYKMAFECFTVVSLVSLLLASACLCRAQAPFCSLRTWEGALWLLCLVPVLMSLLQGQISLLLLLLYAASHVAFTRGRCAVTGLLLSLSLIKWQLALPVLLLLAVWRCWKIVAFAAAGATVLSLVSLRVAGAAGMREYAQSMLKLSGRTAANPAVAKALYGMSAADMPNLHGLFFVLTAGRSLGLLLTAIGSLAVLFWTARRAPTIPLALTTAMLVSYHMQAYDLTLLALPIGTIGADLLAHGQHRTWPSKRVTYSLYVAVIFLLDPVGPLLVWLCLSWTLVITVVAILACLSPRSEQTVEVQLGLAAASS